MTDYLGLAKHNLKRAKEIIEALNIVEVWKSVNAQANLIGSVKTGLMMNNLDIDFHVYSEIFSIADSFTAISKIALNSGIKKITYFNFLNDEDKSLDWHLHYQDTDLRNWRIDIIHLMNESPYVGKAERVTDKINALMNDDIRKNILKIKWDAETIGMKAIGIEVSKAVIEDKVKTIDEFIKWKEIQQQETFIMWEPSC
jgi:hypothetical protein